MGAQREIVIIGGGHNGLVAAFYLAKAGWKPLVLERREVVGGGSVTEEFHPGFRCSTLAHDCGALLPTIARQMQLERHGLQLIAPAVCLSVLAREGDALVLYRDAAATALRLRESAPSDAQHYEDFLDAVTRAAHFLAEAFTLTPPAIGQTPPQDLWGLLKLGRRFRKLGKKQMQRLLRWGPMPVADLAAEWFASDALRAAVAARGIFGTAMGPRSPGTTAVMLLRAAGETHPLGSAMFPRGGLGALTRAMAAAAGEAGAEIRTGAEVGRILVKNGAVSHVALADGEEIAARTVVSGVDPKRTFLCLIDPSNLDPSFVEKIRHYRCPGTVAKVHLALDSLPSFTTLHRRAGASCEALDGQREMLGRVQIGAEPDYLERAFDDSKYGEFSRQPYLEFTVPSVWDETLAPEGKHVMSVHMQYAPFRLRNGDWTQRGGELLDTVIRTLAEYAPDLPNRILGSRVITPQDLEQTYGMTGGHIFHGELSLDQIFSMRPLLGWGRYRTPLRGLYLCGSGTHPGTGLTGGSGYNAAREILKDLRK